MGIRVLAGRAFEPSDDAGRPRVVLINEKLAHREFGDRTPLGTAVYVGVTPVLWEIVGVSRTCDRVDSIRSASAGVRGHAAMGGPGRANLSSGHVLRRSDDPHCRQ